MVDGLILPHSVDAEREVLGALLLGPHLLDDVLMMGLRSKDFYLGRYGHMFTAMVKAYGKHQTFDEVMIKTTLQDMGVWEEAGGIYALSEVLDRKGTTTNVQRYAQIVIEKALKRAIVEAGDRVSHLGFGDLPGYAALDQAEETLRRLQERGNMDRGTNAVDGIKTYMEQVQAIQDGRVDTTRLTTGLPPLDEALGGGFRPGWLVVVMSAAGHGKSALAVNNFALSSAKRGNPVLVCSYEMAAEEVYGRMVAAESGVPVHVQQKPGLSSEEHNRMHGAAETVSSLPLIVEGSRCATVEQIRRTARRIAIERGSIGMVVVDYLQLMKGSTGRRDSTKEEEISHNTRGLKLLAIELGCVVVCLSQPVLEAKRAKRRPHISDAKGSGSIEDDADLALVPWLPARIQPHMNRNSAEIGMDKFRHGEQRSLDCKDIQWSGSRMRFMEATF